MANLYEVPEQLRIFYEGTADTHFFTSPELPGLLIGDPNLRLAFEQISGVITVLVAAKCGTTVECRLSKSFEEFQAEADKLRAMPSDGPHPAFAAALALPQ